MSSPLRALNRLTLLGLALALPFLAEAQNVSPQGGEYSISGPLNGEQLFPHVAIKSFGGYAVWQDNGIDGNGLGIAARRLDNSLSGSFGHFRVNQIAVGDQERPQVTLLNNHGAAIAWQGGRAAYQNIYIRFLNSNGVFQTSGDVRVNTYLDGTQSGVALATLSGGNVVVAWNSLHQDGNLLGVYARVYDENGQPVGAPFQVNQFASFNQRDPAVAALADGNFVVTWVSEDQGVSGIDISLGNHQVHVYARVFSPAGQPLGDEFRVNTTSRICANPAVNGNSGGGFTVAWSHKDAVRTNSWDIYARRFDGAGTAVAAPFRVNTTLYGDQFSPEISSLGFNQLIVWSSLGQDGSWEGVFGQLYTDGSASGGEFQINTTTASKQIQSVVASDGLNRFLVAWSSYVGDTGYDMLAQRLSSTQPLPAAPAPWVAALSASRLMVTWPELAGFPLDHYELYVDGSGTPINVASNSWVASGFGPASTHSFRLAYVLTGGQRSAISDPATGTTWGEDLSGQNGFPDGLPDDWQATYWGYKPGDWQPPWADSDGDGASNYQELLAGTDPTDPNSVLRVRITNNAQGRWLNWSSVPGFIYQVQMATNLDNWTSLGPLRLAAGTTDSIAITGNQSAAYYRVLRMR